MVTSKLAILIVEDQEFLATMISAGLTNQGYQATVKFSISEAIEFIDHSQPNIVVTDLNFGLGPTGLDLIDYIQAIYPWIGIIVLSAHQSAEIATGKPWKFGQEIPYIVKSEVDSLAQIEAAIRSSLSTQHLTIEPNSTIGVQSITKAQAEVLRLVAEGLSNQAIADDRGTTVRAVETLLARTYEALGISKNLGIDSRVTAVQILQSGILHVN